MIFFFFFFSKVKQRKKNLCGCVKAKASDSDDRICQIYILQCVYNVHLFAFLWSAPIVKTD